jgi:sporulation protein YlmC with PRC-barrel domain
VNRFFDGNPQFWRQDMADINIAIEETSSLIASNKVEGTAVYDPRGERQGSIYNFMVNKQSGQVEYAVLQFGGFLGLGSDYYPLPWSKLTYDTGQGGYVIDVGTDTLQGAPHYADEEEPIYNRDYGSQVYDYYGVSYP